MNKLFHRSIIRIKNKVFNKFERISFVRSLRPSDVFIVSYPKSGRNWLQFFLAGIISQRLPKFETKRQYVPPLEAKHAPLRTYNSLPDPRIFLKHTSGYDKHLPKVIYLVRDPRDVMVSYYYHHKRMVPNFNKSIDNSIRDNDMGHCDWGKHVQSWLDHLNKGHIFLVKYEDIQINGEYWFKNILEFCDLHVSDTKFSYVINQSSFKNMRKSEEQSGRMKTYKGDPTIYFVRKGKIGDWKNELSPHLVKIIEKRYTQLMSELGYEFKYINSTILKS